MIINGIEYFVSIFVEDSAGDIIEDYDFHNFEEFNQFIRENKDNPKYKGCKLSYSFVESIDGKPGYSMWDKPIEFRELSNKEIEAEIEDFLSFEEETNSLFAEANAFDKEIHYRENDGEYLSKRVRFNDFSYVCPTCLRIVDDCRCKSYPYYLVQIDTLILPIIRLLNEKGYTTTGCCAGHPKTEIEQFLSSGVHICFDRDYDFDEEFPEGAKYSKVKHCIDFIPTPADVDDLLYFQRRVLDDLMEWAELLDNVY